MAQGQDAVRGDCVLQVEQLSVSVPHGAGQLPIVDDVDLWIGREQIVGLVGESGSGKTVTSMAIAGLLPAAARVEGRVRFEGTDLTALPEADRRGFNGSSIAMIFQDPTSALNPVFTVRSQLCDVLETHQRLKGRAAWTSAVAALEEVGLADPEAVLHSYPHQLSGGMCQRVMIAMALACRPRLLLADEPTTELDVTTQAEIVSLLQKCVSDACVSILFISHDLGLVSQICQTVAVMYAGQIVESGPVDVLLRRPSHPYTRALIDCAVDFEAVGEVRPGIPGRPPSPGREINGCRFADRCPSALARCVTEPQAVTNVAQGHDVRCWRHRDISSSSSIAVGTELR